PGAFRAAQSAEPLAGGGGLRRDFPAQCPDLFRSADAPASDGQPVCGPASRRMADHRPLRIADRYPFAAAAAGAVDLPCAGIGGSAEGVGMIKVMIVDDSAVVRSMLREQLEAEPDIEVIGVAPDPLFAFQKLRTLRPDVLVVDVEMPRMDGLTFLRQLMQDDPIPTIVFSSLAEQGSAVALDAMDAGAVAILCKPGAGVGQFIQEQRAQLVQTVRQAATSRMRKVGRPVQSKTQSVPPLAGTALSRTTDALVAIGTSTGGTRALEYLLKRMP